MPQTFLNSIRSIGCLWFQLSPFAQSGLQSCTTLDPFFFTSARTSTIKIYSRIEFSVPATHSTSLYSTWSARLQATLSWKTRLSCPGGLVAQASWRPSFMISRTRSRYPSFLSSHWSFWASTLTTLLTTWYSSREVKIFGRCVYTTFWQSHWFAAWLCKTFCESASSLHGSTAVRIVGLRSHVFSPISS